MSPLLHSPACDLLGCHVPIVLAGMGGVSRSELVAAVSTAGGFGFLGMVREDPALIAAEVESLRRQGHQRFGVNIIPAATDAALLEAQVTACIALRVPVVGTFWDLDRWLVERMRMAGIVVTHQVGSLEEAIAAERAGVQLIIAQGREAGGHVRGTAPLRELLPAVTAAVDIPVLAAGGLASGDDLVMALALGAQGMVLGTTMIAMHESFAHPYHKQRLLAAEAGDTLLTTDFHINWPPAAPVRVLRSSVTSGALGDSQNQTRTVIGLENGRPIYLFSTDSPLRSMTGDFESMALYAGTGVGEIQEIVHAGDRLRSIVADAEAGLAAASMDDLVESSSPVCYVNETSGDYAGHLSRDELTGELEALAQDLRRALLTVLSDADLQSFASRGADLARALLLTRRLAGSHRLSQTADNQPLSASSLPLIRAAALGRLRVLLPRVPEDVGSRLRQVSALIEAAGSVGVRSGT